MADATALDRSIADLEGLAIERGAYESGRVAWLSRALVSPLAQLGPAELRLLAQHERGLPWILPRIAERLAQEPFTPIDGEPAALLLAALLVPIERWQATGPALARFRAVLEALLVSDLAPLPPPIATRVRDDATIFLALPFDAHPSRP